MLGEVRGPAAGLSREVVPAGRSRAASPCGKARRKLHGYIGEAAGQLFGDRRRQRPFQVGDHLARWDEADDRLYIVLDGVVGLYHDLPTGDRDVLGYCGCGDLIAPARLGGSWGFDATASTDGELLVLDLPDLRCQTTDERDLVWPLFEAACAQLVRRTARLRHYWALPVRARLAAFLFEMDEVLGKASEQGPVLHLPMFRDEIATYLGTRTETICRILTAWKDRGLIVMESPRVLVIPDRALLWADASE